MKMKTHKLLITDEIFEEVRKNFNSVLMKTLHTMRNKGSDNGKVNLELKISFEHDTLEYNGFVFGKETREYTNPIFEHKVTSSIQIKDEVTGRIKGKYELISEDENYYIQEIESPQCSFFDNNLEL